VFEPCSDGKTRFILGQIAQCRTLCAELERRIPSRTGFIVKFIIATGNFIDNSLDAAQPGRRQSLRYWTLHCKERLLNSAIISLFSTLLATALGTLAALGLSQSNIPMRTTLMAMLISPMIVPLIITAAAMFFFYSSVDLQGTYVGVILAHTALATPFVVITVTATLSGFDRTMIRAGLSLGATPATVFFKIVVPLILPGVISGALFAFITSFDEVVVILFVGSYSQHTIPWQMFSGIREQISPTLLAVATILVSISILLLIAVEILRRHSERMRGLSPT